MKISDFELSFEDLGAFISALFSLVALLSMAFTRLVCGRRWSQTHKWCLVISFLLLSAPAGWLSGKRITTWLGPSYEEVEVIPKRTISFKNGRLTMEASFKETSITLHVLGTFSKEVRPGTSVQARRYYNDEDELFVCK